MEKFKAQVISGGRITIPDVVRELLNIEDGDFVEVQVNGKVENQEVAEDG